MTNSQNYQRKIQLIKEAEFLLSAKRKQLSKTLKGFCLSYLEEQMPFDIPPFHKEIMEFVTGDSERILVEAPRGFAKSTICSIALPLWLLLTKPKVNVIIVSATVSLANEMLRRIKNELELNEKIINDFGATKTEKWTEDHIILSNGSTIMAKGRGFQLRGFRPDWLICDDLENENTIYSKEQREKLEQWFLRTVLPTLTINQRLVYVGTRVHPTGLLSKVAKNGQFAHKKYKAIQDDKTSLWEQKWPITELLRRKKEIGEYAFMAEYQNEPLSLESQPVKPHHLDDVRFGYEGMLGIIAVDPAISERESADDRAIVFMERTSEGYREVLSESGKWGIDEQITKIVDIYERHRNSYTILKVIFESVAFQKVYGKLLREEARKRGFEMPVEEVHTGLGGTSSRPKDKFTRLMQVVHLFEQRMVAVENPNLREELLTFPLGDSDNLVDAIVYALWWLAEYQNGGMMLIKQLIKSKFDNGRTLQEYELKPNTKRIIKLN